MLDCHSFIYVKTNFFWFNYSRVLKDLQEWKEAPVDSVVLSLFQLQVFYYNEVKRGLAGLGEYTLLPEFSYLHEHCCEEKSPKEIVQAIKDGKDVVPMKEEVFYAEIITLIYYNSPKYSAHNSNSHKRSLKSGLMKFTKFVADLGNVLDIYTKISQWLFFHKVGTTAVAMSSDSYHAHIVN